MTGSQLVNYKHELQFFDCFPNRWEEKQEYGRMQRAVNVVGQQMLQYVRDAQCSVM